jgi:hypothetical protein
MFPQATEYVMTSESNQTKVAFTDMRSGKKFAGELATGTAAIVMVGTDGRVVAAYNWK